MYQFHADSCHLLFFGNETGIHFKTKKLLNCLTVTTDLDFLFFRYEKLPYNCNGEQIFLKLIELRRLLICILLLLPFTGHMQVKRIGTPNILNYPKKVYHAGTQNWGIAQDPDGFMYFANNDGLLEFDGLKWQLYPVSNTSPVRSVCIDDEGVIYIGLNDDFGIVDTKEAGGPVFRSLRHLLPDDITQTDIIWKIYDTQYGIVFQSFQYIFILQDDEIRVIRPEKAFYYSFFVSNRLFIHEPGVGLFELINGIVHKVPWADELKNTEILSIVSFYENQLLIGTAQNGWFEYRRGKLEKWDVPVNEQVEKDIMFCATKLDGNNLAIGTILNGVIIANSDGNIVQHLNRSKGLGNNTVLSLFNDNAGNLWLGLDNGIDYVELNSPLSYFGGSEGISTGYCCTIHNDLLYFGTNQGLYVKPFNPLAIDQSRKFELVPGTEGQVWSLEVFEDQLVCGHHDGTFIIEGKKAKLINDEPGGWTFTQLKNNPSYMIGGNYSGLSLYQNNASGWEFKHKLKGFNESSRFLAEDESGKIWISHGSEGVFCVEMNEQMDSVIFEKLYGKADGLPENELNKLLLFDKTWYVSTVDGLYAFDQSNDRFAKDRELNERFGAVGRLKTVVQDSNGNLWYIAATGVGVLYRTENGGYAKITAPFKQLDDRLVREWEFLYVFGSDNVFIAIESGFAHYSSRIVSAYNQPFRSFITQVEVPYLESVIYVDEQTEVPEFPFSGNAFRFHYAAPFYQNPGQLEFSYFIHNYSEDWSDWSHDNYRDLTNLHEKKYVFRIKAKNSFGVESEPSSFSFIITPPWYRSKIAFYLYIFSVILLGLFVAWIIQKRFNKTKQLERNQHEKELRKKEEEFEQQTLLAEKEIIRLKNEKLEAEKLSLDKELANQTLNIVQKNRFLLKINQELKRMAEETSDSTIKSKASTLKKRIDKEIDDQQQNKIFESYFEEVHADFFKRLKDLYPQLSPKDLRLCAYIRMNMSTKEIASLLNITDRGVEISRYRLRKKLELSRETNLSTFLLNV